MRFAKRFVGSGAKKLDCFVRNVDSWPVGSDQTATEQAGTAAAGQNSRIVADWRLVTRNLAGTDRPRVARCGLRQGLFQGAQTKELSEHIFLLDSDKPDEFLRNRPFFPMPVTQ